MTQRAGHIVNEAWKLPDAAYILPQTGLLGDYSDLSGSFSQETFDLFLDNKTTTSFTLSNSAFQDIFIDFGSGQKFDCFAFAAENLTRVRIEVSDDGVQYDQIIESNFENRKSGMVVFERQFKRYIHIRTFNLSENDTITFYQMSLGEAIELPRTVDEGFETPDWRSDNEVVHWQSNSPLPSTAVKRLYDVDMNFSMLPVKWMDEKWTPISKANKSFPMWFAWDLNNDPTGVVYGPWTQRAISYDGAYLTSLRLNINGLFK